jgi:hypothetical protein
VQDLQSKPLAEGDHMVQDLQTKPPAERDTYYARPHNYLLQKVIHTEQDHQNKPLAAQGEFETVRVLSII